MYRQSATCFGETEKIVARALHEAGMSDVEIGLDIGVSVNKIIYWRREQGLPENKPQGAEEYTPPVKREAEPRARPAAPSRSVASSSRLSRAAAALRSSRAATDRRSS